jgi:uncharacterized protein (DUF885 family)
MAIALGCVGSPSPPQPDLSWLPADAHAGVVDSGLRQLLDEHWAWTLEQHPVFATRIGIRRFDARLADSSYASTLETRERQRRFAARARQIARSPGLSLADTTTIEIFASTIESRLATSICEFALWSIDPHLGSALNAFNNLPLLHTVVSEQDGINLVRRYHEMPRVLAERTANLRLGLGRGYVASAKAARLTAELIEDELAKAESPLLAPAAVERPDWTPEARNTFADDLRAAVTAQVKPAFAAYARFLFDEIVPRARDAENEGLASIPNGAACYAARERDQTTIPRANAQALHQQGLNEISWINAEMAEIGEAELDESELGPLMWRLRLDPGLQFDSEDEMLTRAEAALAQAEAALPAWFGTLPKARCEIEPVPAYRAAASPAGYYSMHGAAEERVGRFYINTHRPGTRPRFGVEALVYHESIPGHHLQISLAQEIGALPAFRRYSGAVAFTEGWGLYAERLAVEMHLYGSPLDQMGQLNAEAWRAARLVVDTGLHALGWTREDATRFMLGHTALAEHDIETEVGRYLTNPGQALAYKAGQLEILRLRQKARERLGDRFDIRGFHDAVLLGGAVPLPTLQQQIDRWIEAQTP